MKWLLILFACGFVQGDGWFSDIWNNFLSFRSESCDDKYFNRDFINSLKKDLSYRLHGQHLVFEKLIPVLHNHYMHDPKKALVICMNGWSGGGKNFVTEMIVSNLYKLKMKSSFVHFFSGRLHFPLSTPSAINDYKINLQTWVKGNVSICPYSTFIFDEIDKVPAEIIEGIKPYFDYHSQIDSVSYKNAAFFFLSNIGGNLITQKYMELWQDGIPRHVMEYRSFEPLLRRTLYTSGGAFQKSSLLEDHLVTLYLPFLPLEKEHVMLCIKDEFERQGYVKYDVNSINEVVKEIEFYDDRFSISGCKRVTDQVAQYIFKNTIRIEF